MVLMALRWVPTDLTEKAPHDGGAEELMKGFRKPPFSLVRSPEHDSSDHCLAALPELYTLAMEEQHKYRVQIRKCIRVPRHHLAPMGLRSRRQHASRYRCHLSRCDRAAAERAAGYCHRIFEAAAARTVAPGAVGQQTNQSIGSATSGGYDGCV